MITRKRWTVDEESYLLEVYDRLKNNGAGWQDAEIFEELSTWNEFKEKNRTKAALQKRYGELTEAKIKNPIEKKDGTFNEFLQGLENLKNGYDVLYKENQWLRSQIEDLKQKEADFNLMAQIMEQARKMVVNEHLGAHEKPRFKMDGNGNLERM